MTEPVNTPSNILEQFEDILKQLSEYKNYFSDKDSINELVNWLHEETGFNKASLNLAIKYIVPLIIASVAVAGAAVTVSWKRKILERLTQYQWCFNFCQWLLNMLKTKTDKSLEKALAVPSIKNLEKLINNDPRWELLSPEQQGLIQLLLGQNSLSEGQDLRHQQLDAQLKQLLRSLEFDLDLKTPELLSQDAQTAKAGSSQWLTYTSRQAYLVGRENSMALLDDFIDQDDEFSWWVVSGVGGVGKSRLALEALLRHDYLWEVGFLKSSKLQKPDALSQWQPKHPTFIVIDYAAEYAHPIADWIDHIIQHQTDYDFPVRLLILERETKGQRWWEHLSAGSSDALRRQQKLFMPQSHELEPLASSVHQAAVLQNFLDSLKADNQLPDLDDSFWQNLNTLTDQGRPLFIGMAALAIQQHGVHQIRQWYSQQDLLQEMLTREKNLWKKQLADAENPAQIMQLFALSTVVAGFDWDKQEDQLLDGLIALDLLKNDYQAKQVNQKLMTLAGHQGGYLQPDLLAEYFVLQHWAEADRPIKKLLLFAHQLAPENTLAFISRCAIDYPDHKSSWLWWHGLRKKLSDKKQLDDLYCTAFRIVGQLDLHRQYRINLQHWLPALCELENQQWRTEAIDWTTLQYDSLGDYNKAFEQYQIALPPFDRKLAISRAKARRAVISYKSIIHVAMKPL